MANNTLIGKKLILMVSDPWDFGTEHGNGPFEVTVKSESRSALLLKLSKSFMFDGVEWEMLSITSRHEGVDILTLVKGGKIHVNAIRVTKEEAESDTDSFGWSFYRGRYSMLIGSLQLKRE
jgi:hypothetical protein